jgi:hypothetical protein
MHKRTVHRSGDRQPAVGVSIAGAVAFVSHGWLTPAAPGARRSFAGKSFLTMRQSNPHQERRPSARRGSQPHRQRQSPTHPRRPTAKQERGGVSPPWVRRAHLQPVAKVAGWLLASAARRGLVGGGFSVVCRELTCSCVSGTTAGLRQPLLVARRSFAGKSFLTMRGRTRTKSGGRQPAGAR